MPIYAARIQAGTPAAFNATFYDALTGNPGDPLTVEFSWSVTDGAVTTWVYGVDMEVTRTVDGHGVAHYQAIVPTLGLAPVGSDIDLTGQWDTEGGITVSASIDALIVAPEIPSPF